VDQGKKLRLYPKVIRDHEKDKEMIVQEQEKPVVKDIDKSIEPQKETQKRTSNRPSKRTIGKTFSSKYFSRKGQR